MAQLKTLKVSGASELTGETKILNLIGDDANLKYNNKALAFTDIVPAAYATAAQGAKADSAAQPENTIKSLSIDGRTITYTKGDNSTGTLTTQDTTSFTITANATDGIFDITGTNGTNAVTYAVAPYSTQQTQRSFDISSTNPTRSDRLNYNGYLYATKLYSDAKEVLTAHQTMYYRPVDINGETVLANTNNASLSFASGSTNGTINIQGIDVAIKGLGSNAYTNTTYLPVTGGTMTGALTVQNNTNYTTKQARNISYYQTGATLPTASTSLNGDMIVIYE